MHFVLPKIASCFRMASQFLCIESVTHGAKTYIVYHFITHLTDMATFCP